jgi:hypothetical protein
MGLLCVLSNCWKRGEEGGYSAGVFWYITFSGWEFVLGNKNLCFGVGVCNSLRFSVLEKGGRGKDEWGGICHDVGKWAWLFNRKFCTRIYILQLWSLALLLIARENGGEGREQNNEVMNMNREMFPATCGVFLSLGLK